jgi:hypothetical protein
VDTLLLVLLENTTLIAFIAISEKRAHFGKMKMPRELGPRPRPMLEVSVVPRLKDSTIVRMFFPCLGLSGSGRQQTLPANSLADPVSNANATTV